MAGRRKLIVVSNRGPVVYDRDDAGERRARRGGGGLVTALRSLVEHHDVTWIASAMSEEDRVVVDEVGGVATDEVARGGAPYRLHLVAHDPTAYDWYYNVVANPMLWFLQHYLWGLASAPDVDHGLHHAWNEGYVAVNRGFAEAVVAELERQPEAAVFFHDYHLYVAPGLVREQVPDALMAHFVHIPWPMPDYWRVLPDAIRRAIHEGMLANDVVSFHTSRWRHSFQRSCEDILGIEPDRLAHAFLRDGHRTRLRARPISVDPAEFDEIAGEEAVLAAEAELMAGRPEHLILRVDRTDPSKNVVRGFRAYELYLDAHPEMHERVQMLALLDPSRQDIPEYAEYLGAIQRAARAVNDRFQRDGWVPLDLRIQDDFHQAVAAYKQYDVLLVNAVRDGLNLVAKEASLVNRRDGVVVLSENTGAFEELREWVVAVDPYDLDSHVAALEQALALSADERRSRAAALRTHVRAHDLDDWVDAIDGELRRVSTMRA